MKLAALFRFVLFATVVGLGSNVWMGQRTAQLEESQAKLLEMRVDSVNALRLLQSEFNALQTLVAAFVVSKNNIHLVNYYELLDAHAGARQYATPVDNMYWSNLIAGNIEAVPLLPAKGETLESRLMVPERLTSKIGHDQLGSVDAILRLSKQLREHEQIVFALSQGFYDPVRKRYAAKAEPRDDLAIQMLYSEEYLGMTDAIRSQIQGRIGAVERGFQTVIAQQAENINATVALDFYLGLLVAVLALVGLAVLQRCVVEPLRELNNVSKLIALGNYKVDLPKPNFVTEMVNLIKGFELMIGAFRRELEQTEAAQNAQLLALEAKMGRERAEAQAEARGMLLANMSHEIRTPMNAILGMTALTLKSDLPEQERAYLLKAQDAAKSLLSLLNDILDFSKAEAGMVEFEHIPFTLDEVLTNSFLAVQSQAAARKLLLLNQVAPGYCTPLGQRLVGDPTRLRQVLINLLSNAVKFTEGGAVRVLSTLTVRSDTSVDLRIEVHDSGPGLSKAQVERIFEKFAQGDSSVSRVYGGTGLGLSISRELVTRMGGEISVESTQGKGSCFWFTVPLTYEQAGLHDALPLARQRAVLLHPPGEVAECLLSVLESTGLQTRQVSTLGGLLNALASGPVNWLLIQSDVQEANAQLPPELLDILNRPDACLVAIDRDFLSADSALLAALPVEQGKRLLHLAHPVLTQDLVNAPRRCETRLAPRDPEKLAAAHLKGRKILVLEDHPVNQVLIRSLLESVHMEVTLCEQGEQAVSLLDLDDCVEFDAIITDLEMPVMDGYEFMVWLRDQTRWMDTPVIGLTGHAFSETRMRCLELGMDDFITKPIEAHVLYNALLQILVAHKQPTITHGSRMPALPNLFLAHCADLPAKLAICLASDHEDAFAREIHSMVSLLALLDEQALHCQFREFEQGLSRGSLKADIVLNEIRQMWPALVRRYQQQAKTTTSV